MSATARPLAAAALIAFTACGGGDGASAPTTALNAVAPVSFTVVAGDSRQPLAGARIVVAGAEHASDAQGRVTLPAAPPPEALVDILFPGYFDRQTVIARRGTAGEFTLWPRTHADGLTEDFTNEVVYTSSSVSDPVRGAAALSRWAFESGEVAVAYAGPSDSPEYLPFSADALGVQRAAVDVVNGVGLPVRYAHPAAHGRHDPHARPPPHLPAVRALPRLRRDVGIRQPERGRPRRGHHHVLPRASGRGPRPYRARARPHVRPASLVRSDRRHARVRPADRPAEPARGAGDGPDDAAPGGQPVPGQRPHRPRLRRSSGRDRLRPLTGSPPARGWDPRQRAEARSSGGTGRATTRVLYFSR